jgi:hypothetical protein
LYAAGSPLDKPIVLRMCMIILISLFESLSPWWGFAPFFFFFTFSSSSFDATFKVKLYVACHTALP